MADNTISPDIMEDERPIFGDIVARDVSAEEFMEKYAESRHEWVNGVVIKMSPVSLRHYFIVQFLTDMLRVYFKYQSNGQVLGEPFVMRIDAVKSRREPEVMVILDNNPGELTETAMIGPADIAIEVVSPGSTEIDYGNKFFEYEKAGVGEYWIVDPIRKTATFHRLNDEGIFKPFSADAEGHYETPLLPKLKIHVPTLWQEELPDIIEVVAMVQDMVGQ